MSRQTAAISSPLSVEERKAHVAALVAAGKLTLRQAGLIRFDEAVPDSIRKAARELAPAAKRALARGRRRAA